MSLKLRKLFSSVRVHTALIQPPHTTVPVVDASTANAVRTAQCTQCTQCTALSPCARLHRTRCPHWNQARIVVHCIALHCTALHCTALQSNTVHPPHVDAARTGTITSTLPIPPSYSHVSSGGCIYLLGSVTTGPGMSS